MKGTWCSHSQNLHRVWNTNRYKGLAEASQKQSIGCEQKALISMFLDGLSKCALLWEDPWATNGSSEACHLCCTVWGHRGCSGWRQRGTKDIVDTPLPVPLAAAGTSGHVGRSSTLAFLELRPREVKKENRMTAAYKFGLIGTDVKMHQTEKIKEKLTIVLLPVFHPASALFLFNYKNKHPMVIDACWVKD